MHLAEIKIKGFRNLQGVVVALEKGLNVLVGPNNIGKTNLFDALRVALGPTAASDGAPIRLERDDFHRSTSDAVPSATIRIDLTFKGLTNDQIAHFHEMVEPNLEDITRTTATLHFEATWNEKRGRATFQRWGGSEHRERASVSVETLQALPVTFLPALRSAEAALTPGYKNRIAHLFRDRIERQDDASSKAEKNRMVSIYDQANKDLLRLEVVDSVQKDLRGRVRSMAGSDYVEPTMSTAPPDYHRILRTLCLEFTEGPVLDVARSGLGYSNLLYIAVVLTHLGHAVEGDLPILIVEEPEAHLHPQLVQLLAKQLQVGSKDVQTLVSTHSPSLAASIDPRKIRPMFRASGRVHVGSLAKVGMDDLEARQLRRMIDATRASLLFARAAILVEGISESLLIPALAARQGFNLREQHVSVIPIVGVAFNVFRKLLGQDGLCIRVAIISDSDPALVTRDDEGNKLAWDALTPERDKNNVPVPSARAIRLREAFEKHTSVDVFTSMITLEHELAAAGRTNPKTMVDVWEGMFDGKPRTLNQTVLEEAGPELPDQALAVWRGICLSNTSGSKAEFAHHLAEDLERKKHPEFIVPDYIKNALDFVLPESTDAP